MGARPANPPRRLAVEEPPTRPRADARANADARGIILPFWLVLWMILIAAGLLVLVLAWFFPETGQAGNPLPFAIRSPLQADYSVDPRSGMIAPLELDLIAESLADDAPGSLDPTAQYATLVQALNTLVPSITPSGPTLTAQPTATLQAATATLTESAAPTLEGSPTVTATLTPSLTATGEVTSTPTRPAPAATRRPTDTRPAPTHTRPAPTEAPPTAVPPTNTPPPPTAPPPTQPPPPTEPPAYPPPGYPAP